MIIYIIGPIQGRVDGNRAAFDSALRETRARYPGAFIVLPRDIYTPSTPEARRCPALRWCEAMIVCVPVARAADLIVALYDWQTSPGARVEERERTGRLEVLE